MAEEEIQSGEVKRDKPVDENAYDVVDIPATKQSPQSPMGDQTSILEGFAADTDFDKDPALKEARVKTRSSERVTIPNPTTITAGDSESDEEDSQDIVVTDALIRDGLLPLKVVAATGGILVIVAGGVKWNAATELGSGLPFAILTIYFCLLHAATGTLALILMSLLQKRPAGKYGLGAARMLVAVSVFLALANLNLPYQLSFVLAAPGYLLAVMLLFRLRPNVAIQIAGIHGAIALAVQLGFFLQELGMPTKGAR